MHLTRAFLQNGTACGWGVLGLDRAGRNVSHGTLAGSLEAPAGAAEASRVAATRRRDAPAQERCAALVRIGVERCGSQRELVRAVHLRQPDRHPAASETRMAPAGRPARVPWVAEPVRPGRPGLRPGPLRLRP